jgi:hypothetical protein
MSEGRGTTPVYTGMRNYVAEQLGFKIWVPSDWHEFEMEKGHKGIVFAPYADDFNTCLSAEKIKLKYVIKEADVPVLREGFQNGMKALPGVEIEKFDESLTDPIYLFDARFTFLDGDVRRKRWVRNVYWGNGQLVLIAQGKDVADFDYWEPMFFNAMYTADIK